jgi:hypothetical protein
MKIYTKFIRYFVFLSFLIAVNCTFAQDLGITFNGFIKADYMFDTRQNLAVREGHFYLWPLEKKLDSEGEDINATPNFNILSVQSRLQSKITGPEVFGAKTSGYVEMEFFGTTDANINTLRLRHAFVDIDWEKTKIRTGQFWHPLFNTDCFAGTISFNTGAPFQPFSRNPQIRLVQKVGGVSITLAAVSQRDFTSAGPDGFSSKYLRNSVIPEVFAGFQYSSPNFIIGTGGAYKMLTPRISTTASNSNETYKTDEKIGTYAANLYTKIIAGLFSMKFYGVYGQNLVDLMLPGGYAVVDIDPETGAETYTPFNNMSLWTDLAYGKEIEVGLFGAYGKVLGTTENTIKSIYYGRGYNISSLYRVSPRIAYKKDNYRIALEIEYTTAEYGNNDPKDKNLVIDSYTVSNLRGLLAFYLFF